MAAQDHFIRDGPPGSIGAANGSGWMTETEFESFIRHFVKEIRPTKEDPVLLLLDNHQSHLSVPVIDFCKQNGVVLLSFPPHCSHKLQPLDRGVYGPLKTFVNSFCDAWMKNHPGKVMSIYDIPGIVRDALPRAATQINIAGGFRASGIVPYNPHIFRDDEFLASSVTDRPLPEDVTAVQQQVENLTLEEDTIPLRTIATTSTNSTQLGTAPQANPTTSTASTTAPDFNLEAIFPLPKAPPRKVGRGRPRRHYAVLTDTPERNALAEQSQKRRGGAIQNPPGQFQERNGRRGRGGRGSRGGRPQVGSSSRKKKNGNPESGDALCLHCQQPFSSDKNGEIWIQCSVCLKWGHEDCVEGDGNDEFVCLECV